MTKQKTNPIMPSISLPVKEATKRDDLNDVKPLEYIKIRYSKWYHDGIESSEGFFGGGFNVKGEPYFTLLGIVSNINPEKIHLISDLYRAGRYLLTDESEKQTILCKKDDLEKMINRHLNLFKKIITKNQAKPQLTK